MRGERPGALDLLGLIRWTTYTHPKKNFTLQHIERACNWISDPERLVTQTGNGLRRFLLLPSGSGAHLLSKLLLPVLSWTRTFAVCCEGNTHCHTDGIREFGRAIEALRETE